MRLQRKKRKLEGGAALASSKAALEESKKDRTEVEAYSKFLKLGRINDHWSDRIYLFLEGEEKGDPNGTD